MASCDVVASIEVQSIGSTLRQRSIPKSKGFLFVPMVAHSHSLFFSQFPQSHGLLIIGGML